MRFAAPGYLWLLLFLPVVAGLLALASRRRRHALAAIGDLVLIRRLSTDAGTERRVIRAALLLLALFFLVLALSRPQWGARLETMTRRGVDVIVAVDTSLSMLAEDVKPNRLAQARAAVSSLIDMMGGDRIGLVAFSGAAYVACPLTLDHSAAALFVDVLDTDLIPVRGTGIAAAITTSIEAFRSNERRYKVLILITDGEDHEGDVEVAARAAADAGIRIFTIGVGSPSGEPIPLRNARGDVVGYKEDQAKRKVTSRLGEGALESVALTTGGRYYRASTGGVELQRIYEEMSGMDQKTLSARPHTAYEERYQIPLVLAILLLGLEAAVPDRRRRGSRGAGREETA